ncbi:hypothetical protein I2494_15695 [Budviciaceae bacterium BWR-B9]|uniref:DUF4105 domain-containing protein n=1 Tax=Limnobaculum allomyrinae TaxID=2791986 RepID=A0ABS1ITR9_9GAMM|nr:MULTISPECIES: hypothetical protein [Limnobaculum]MBK5145133.1 hypothetical protein [Limnobaculum allomyrinae]MBV7692964.1 hypothetical protein [Limnobaculum sp. M2-1]
MVPPSLLSKLNQLNPLLAIVPLLFLLFLLPFLHVSALVTILVAVGFLILILAVLHKKKRNIAVLIFISLSIIWIWQAHFTWQGYFWINARELDSLVHKISSYGKIRSLELGSDGSYQDGDRVVHYDSYRFLNGVRVTHYPDAHNPKASQPEWFIDAYCQQHEISLKLYYELRSELKNLRISGFSLMDNGDISFILWQKGGVPWTINLVHIEDGTHPLDGDTLEKLNAHWYIATYS